MTPVLNIWIGLLAWGIIYLTDYYLTIYSARVYQSGGYNYVRFEGSFELTPQFQKDVDRLRLFSPSFMWRWLISLPAIYLIWWLSGSLNSYFAYDFLLGGLMLREAAILLRHARNLAAFRMARNPASLRGALLYSRRMTLALSAAELGSFAIFYLILAIPLWSAFFLGGAVVTAFTAFQHWRLARKAAWLPADQAEAET